MQVVPGLPISYKMVFYINKDGSIWHQCYDKNYRAFYQRDGKCGALINRKFCNIQIPTILLNNTRRKEDSDKRIWTDTDFPMLQDFEPLKDSIKIEI